MLLTSLSNTKAWLNIPDTNSDAILTRLIAQASRMIMNYINRPDFSLQTFNEMQDGRDTNSITLRNYPVVAIKSLSVWGVNIMPSNGMGTYGWMLESLDSSLAARAQTLSIIAGYPPGAGAGESWGRSGSTPRGFSAGRDNVLITYQAGYCIQSEPQTIPAISTYTLTPNALYGSWSGDNGVTFANGTPLTSISSGIPTTGQYLPPNISGNSPTLVYTFAAADAGKEVLLNYNYVPFDIEQACIEIVSERFKYRNNIGVKSRSMGGVATDTFSMVDFQPYVATMLAPYKREWEGP